jgi:hypothetical protein
MSHTTGGFGIGSPETLLVRTDARSNGKPSTCITSTQYRRLSKVVRRPIGWLALRVFPIPV